MRVAFSISRRVGNAVTRNRLRRRLRALLDAAARDPLMALPEGDYLFIADSQLARITYADLAKRVHDVIADVRTTVGECQ